MSISIIETSDGEFQDILSGTPEAPIITPNPNTSEKPSEAPVSDLPAETPNDTPEAPKEPEAPENEVKTPKQEDDKEFIVDPQLVYDTLFNKPIKASGKEIRPKSLEDVIRLVQMGADYSKKNEALKQDKRLVAALKEGGISKQEDINLLIDVMNGSPEAIKQLLTDKQLDNVFVDNREDIDATKKYTPKNYIPTDSAVELKETLNDIQQDMFGISFVKDVMGKYDLNSLTFLENNPKALAQLYQEKVTGDYDIIMAEVDRRLTVADPSIANKSMIDAYAVVASERLASRQQQQAPKANAVNQDKENHKYEEQKRNIAKPSPAKARNGAINNDKVNSLLTTDFSTLNDVSKSDINQLLIKALGAN